MRRVLWLLRQVLPLEDAEERFADRLRALQGVLENVQKGRVTFGPGSDLGFGIRRGSVLLRASQKIAA